MFYFYIPFSLTLVMFSYIFITTILHCYQLEAYNIKATTKNIVKQFKVGDIIVYITAALLFYLLFFAIDNFVFKVVWISLFNFLFFVYLISFLPEDTGVKLPLKFTKRVIRFLVIYFVLLLACYILLGFCMPSAIIYNSLFNLIPIIGVIVFYLSHFIAIPIEKCIYLFYLNKSKSLLNKRGDLIKIGITGSFGKTSTKFMLQTILSEKYSVLATPNSFNTPMGISKTVLTDLKNNHQIFIMEMGANRVGDIKYLCRAFKPQIGMLTSIGKCHLETFKTPQNIISTKCELPENLYDSKLMVFNGNDKNIVKYANKYRGNKIIIADDGELYAENIVTSVKGTSFDVYYKQEYFLTAKTKLIGEHNVNNILLCVGVAIFLGLSKQQIIRGICKIESTKNRLELITNSKGVTFLNDSYNSNPNGCEVALKTLALFNGKNKIVITPGMVELGDDQYKENYKFGKQISKVANKVYIVNNVNKEALCNGLFDGNFDFNNLVKVSSFNKIDFAKFTNDDVILIENDLPDNYK